MKEIKLKFAAETEASFIGSKCLPLSKLIMHHISDGMFLLKLICNFCWNRKIWEQTIKPPKSASALLGFNQKLYFRPKHIRCLVKILLETTESRLIHHRVPLAYFQQERKLMFWEQSEHVKETWALAQSLTACGRPPLAVRRWWACWGSPGGLQGGWASGVDEVHAFSSSCVFW